MHFQKKHSYNFRVHVPSPARRGSRGPAVNHWAWHPGSWRRTARSGLRRQGVRGASWLSGCKKPIHAMHLQGGGVTTRDQGKHTQKKRKKNAAGVQLKSENHLCFFPPVIDRLPIGPDYLTSVLFQTAHKEAEKNYRNKTNRVL